MINSIGTIKDDHDTFEVIVDQDDYTVFLAPLGQDEGILIHKGNIPKLIKLLQQAEVFLTSDGEI